METCPGNTITDKSPLTIPVLLFNCTKNNKFCPRNHQVVERLSRLIQNFMKYKKRGLDDMLVGAKDFKWFLK